ncbi:hypothetical protein B0H21DRAFT_500602 [Amylocystis lapponica]|nr:hypothetical protein B0H21DRAFT_500602 [Amylocystis lapponica]
MSDASYLRGTSENGSTSSNQGYSNGMLRATAADASETASLVTLRPRAMSETLYPRRDHFGSLDSDVLELTPACPEGTRLTTPATWQSPDLAYSERPFSVVSLSTDQELRDIAEMMSTPDPDDRGADSEDDTPHTPTPEVPGALSDDLVMGMFEQRPDDSYSATYSRSRSNSASSVLTPPSHTDSEGDYFSDDFCDSAVLSPSKENFPAYHLPRSPSAHWDSDTPSLSSSASYISLSTPSLSRKSSFHPSPPVSPTSATSLITPVDAFALPPLPPKHLGVIEEAQTPEDDDAEARWSRRRLQGLLAAEASPATISRPPSPVRPRSKSHSGAVFSRLFSASALNLSLSKAEEKKKKKEAAKEQRRSADAVKPRKYAEPAVFLENSMLSGDPFSPMP